MTLSGFVAPFVTQSAASWCPCSHLWFAQVEPSLRHRRDAAGSIQLFSQVVVVIVSV